MDQFCPSMEKIKNNKSNKYSASELQRRICTKCGINYPTLVGLKAHAAVCCRVEILDSDDSDSDIDDFVFLD